VNTSLTKDQNVIIKAWTQAAELTTKYLEGQQAVEVAKVLGGYSLTPTAGTSLNDNVPFFDTQLSL
jgi:hypothetical protein